MEIHTAVHRFPPIQGISTDRSPGPGGTVAEATHRLFSCDNNQKTLGDGRITTMAGPLGENLLNRWKSVDGRMDLPQGLLVPRGRIRGYAI